METLRGTASFVAAVHILLSWGDTLGDNLLSRGKFACIKPGIENWPSLHRKLLKFLNRESTLAPLSSALERASTSDLQLADDTGEEDSTDTSMNCVFGQVSLRLLLLLAANHAPEPVDASQMLLSDWNLLGTVGWVQCIRSGWPVFRLLRSLQLRTGKRDVKPDVQGCQGSEAETKYVSILEQYVGMRTVSFPGETLISASMAYLAEEDHERCPLTVAAAFLAVAWSRYPVYDADTEAIIRKAQAQVAPLQLEVLLATRHPILPLLDDVAGTYQDFLIDSGALYKDESEGASNVPDYTRHMMDDDAFAATPGGDCVVSFARTPRGRCNVFAPISRNLWLWRKTGVAFEDTLHAFRQITDQKNILFRIIGDELHVVTPKHSHFSADFGSMEPRCLAEGILDVLALAELPDLDFVLNHGDLPLLRASADRPPFYNPRDRDARLPAPLFSICASEDFWDILFPNICRPTLVNISNLSTVPWKKKLPAVFWRGTDRGSVNWALNIEDMWRGSPRKEFLDKWGEENTDKSLFNLAFLADDLLNSTIVNTDENFVPLERWLDWKYLLDIPGNGYSGSLKQKLTGSSATLLVTDIGRADASPVYEHYHAGLQDQVHILSVSLDNAVSKVKWALDHDKVMEEMVRNANGYMSQFEELWHCYVWRLLKSYGELLNYTPEENQTAAFGDVNVQVLYIHRRPTKSEAESFAAKCLRLVEEHSQ